MMTEYKPAGLGKYAFALCLSAILFFLVSGLPSTLLAKEQLSVTQDKEKTVYSIDSSDKTRQEDKEERDRAWDMLNRMPIMLDNRQNVPVRPVPAK
jgi:hypothetical protein